jgi:DNA polymerase I
LEKVAEARRFGYVSDVFGRIRFVPEVYCPIESIQEAGARQAANMPVTSTAQGIIKIAMVEMMRDRRRRHWENKVRFEMQIHDSLIVEINDNDDEAQEVGGWMKKIMCGVVQLCVPVDVDVKQGTSWGETSKLKLEDKK